MARGAPLPFDPIEEARRQWGQRWHQADAMAAVTSVFRAQQVLLARIDAALRPLGLTFARYEALVLLHVSRRGALPLGKMGRRLMVHPASVTNAVDRLESQGLVRRVAHPTDGRTTLAEITPAGRRVVERATAALEEVRFGLGPLSGSDAERITDLLRPLRRDAGDFVPERATLDE
ncbi:MAG: MarR family transcriptional regulator [Acidimicrobiales bacterium]|nr:MarR family transcriptional regulator [Acidimicrobiales bacterium]